MMVSNNCMAVKMMGMVELQVMCMMESKLKLVVKLKTMQTVYVRFALALLSMAVLLLLLPLLSHWPAYGPLGML